MLHNCFREDCIEAGCDEAGRGCLAGPVFAAAVILPHGFECEELNDSKKISERLRYQLRKTIEENATAYAIGIVYQQDIDKINILNASIAAMHKALDGLSVAPQHIIVDGNRFKPYKDIPFRTIVKGDGKYMSIAAASILAKTYRDDYMNNLAKQFPAYGWDKNKGYPTKAHRRAIMECGITEHHRKSFTLTIDDNALKLDL